MKIYYCFVKTFKENLRDWKIVILAVVFAPFFVYVMYLYMEGSGSVSYNILVLNRDRGGQLASDLVSRWKNIKTDGGAPVLVVNSVRDTVPARQSVKNRVADLFVTIPDGYSDSFGLFLAAGNALPPPIVYYGDQSNVRFTMAASFLDYTSFNFICEKAGIIIPMNVRYESAGVVRQKSEFDLYVPALLVLSVIIILFTAGASVIREVEKDTISRLILSRLKSREFMTALSLNQLIIGLACFSVTLGAAYTVGYRSTGSMTLLLLLALVTTLSVISISIITSCFIKNMFGLLTLGCFPFFILMFFSDCFMPLPKINMLMIAGNQLYLTDILPTATATRAINKILNYDCSLKDIYFELLWILALSLAYFTAGVTIFRKKYGY